MSEKRKILIRFDDICPTMNYVEWEKANNILKSYNIKPILGVIPDNQDKDLKIEPQHEDFWKYIQHLQNNGYAIAMHGLHHIWNSREHGIVNQTLGSEFAGLSYQRQEEIIRQGKKMLERHGIYTNVFFAPRHSYDENTLKALAANGFTMMLDGKSRKPMMRQGILCIPCRSGGCPKIKSIGYYTAVFHVHEWVRPDKADGYDQLKFLCKNYHADIVDFLTYAKRPCGSTQQQILNEKIYVFYEYHIRPILSFVKHRVLKL